MKHVIQPTPAKTDFAITPRLLPASADDQNLPSNGASRSEVLHTYSVVLQAQLTRNAEDCFFGSAPTLGFLNRIFGDGTAQEWLVYQLDDLSEYCGAREKLTVLQIQTLAELLSQEYSWLKVTEVMLFMRRFKLGRYGRFYGAVDPLIITSSLLEFLKERTLAYYERASQMEGEKGEKSEEWELHSIKVNMDVWRLYCSIKADTLRRDGERMDREGKKSEAKAMYGKAEEWESKPYPLQRWTKNKVGGESVQEESPIEVLKIAKAILTDIPSDKYVQEAWSRAFRKHHGCTPQEYIEKNELLT